MSLLALGPTLHVFSGFAGSRVSRNRAHHPQKGEKAGRAGECTQQPVFSTKCQRCPLFSKGGKESSPLAKEQPPTKVSPSGK